jgi:RimJ/RimL family protein N-acetyltransferase
MYATDGPVSPWLGYLAEDEQGILVGTCAFKSAPSSSGVEIAYFTFPEYEGRGYATSMANQLIDIARARSVRVTAQTLPQLSASTRILQKLGFVHMGAVQHQDDGEVWEWALPGPPNMASIRDEG